jgi:radical SAM superfamily enzyme YgiQ (UPF0313 family)
MGMFDSIIKTDPKYIRLCYRPGAILQEETFNSSRHTFALMGMAPYNDYQFSLGMDIITNSLRKEPGIYIDHAVWLKQDLERAYRINRGYYSDEPLGNFDFIGMGLYFMASYLMIVKALIQIGVHPLADKRGDSGPIIIAGGGCTVDNPEPVADFFDIMIIGEGEKVLPEIINRHKRGMSKRAFLDEIYQEIDCAYIPSMKKRVVKKRMEPVIHPLRGDDFVSKERNKPIELIRGCNRKCYFCGLGWTRMNPAYADVEDVCQAVQSWPEGTHIYPFAPDESSYEQYQQIMACLGDRQLFWYNQRIDTYAKRLAAGECNTYGNHTHICHGIDGISDRCREWVKKGITSQQIDEVLKFDINTYRTVKLNMILSMPCEKNKDWAEFEEWLDHICKLRLEYGDEHTRLSPEEVEYFYGAPSNERFLSEEWRELTNKKSLVMYVIAPTPFVPTPHTPMQWFPSCHTRAKGEWLESIVARVRRKYGFIKQEGLNGPISHDCSVVVHRADRSFSRVLLRLAARGAVLGWAQGAERCLHEMELMGIDHRRYLKEIPLDAALPWEFVDVGVEGAQLKRIYRRMREEAELP